jgi:small subunit ribosomal protein S6e
MANFKIVVADPKTRKAFQKEVPQPQSGLMGRKLGDKLKGDGLGFQGYELQITGGSDKDGFPMRRDVDGAARKRLLLSFGPGFHPWLKGQRKRKSVRGNTISGDIVQVNLKVVTHGPKALAALFGKEEKAPEERKAAEEPKAGQPKPESKPEAHKEEKAEHKEKAEKPPEDHEEHKPEKAG